MSTNPGYLTPIGSSGADGLALGSRYRVPSGLGGSFDVILLSLDDQNGATVRVEEPRNPDWHAYTFCTAPANLKPIPRLWQVRTRVGSVSGEPDDFLSWGKYPQRHEAEAAAKAAGRFPACHPIKIAEIDG
jgi:hypothetical protein